MPYSRTAAVVGSLLFMGWEVCGCWVFVGIVVWLTHRGSLDRSRSAVTVRIEGKFDR